MLKRLICLASVFAILCLSIVSVGAASTDPYGLNFYTDINYSRNPVTLSEGRYNLAQLNAAGIRNDDISSIKISNGYIMTIYEHDNFEGKYWTFKSNTPNMVNYGCNDIMSSVVIDACPDLVITNVSIIERTPTTITYTYTFKNRGVEVSTLAKCFDIKFQFSYMTGNLIYLLKLISGLIKKI